MPSVSPPSCGRARSPQATCSTRRSSAPTVSIRDSTRSCAGWTGRLAPGRPRNCRARSPGCRSSSKISVRTTGEHPPVAGRVHWPTYRRPSTRPWSGGGWTRAWWSSARPTPRSSGPRESRSPNCSAPPGTHGTPAAAPGAPRAGPPPRSRPASSRSPGRATAAVRSASRPRAAGSSASNPAADWSRWGPRAARRCTARPPMASSRGRFATRLRCWTS